MARGNQALGLLAAIVLLAAPAHQASAMEGVIEINQAKVAAQGGFPFTINHPGSYRLTGSLNPGHRDAIEVFASPVSIDLNGFSIIGDAGNIGSGILAGQNVGDVAVSNGSVRGMSAGIDLHDDSRVERVRATSNGSGILCGDRCSAVGNDASHNAGLGLGAG